MSAASPSKLVTAAGRSARLPTSTTHRRADEDHREPQGIASGKIYNIGNPKNNYFGQGPRRMMVKLALEYAEYRANAKKVRLVKTTAGEYYGKGYQDVQNRVPKISQSEKDLGWRPRVNMRDALKRIFDAYRTHVAEARRLVE